MAVANGPEIAAGPAGQGTDRDQDSIAPTTLRKNAKAKKAATRYQ